jgi:hypothetical protein
MEECFTALLAERGAQLTVWTSAQFPMGRATN